MPVYWSMLGWVAVCGFLWRSKPREANNKSVQKMSYFTHFFIFFYIIFWTGLRSGIADTWVFISGFEAAPSELAAAWNALFSAGKGAFFEAFKILIKSITGDYHVWLFLVALITGLLLVKGFYDMTKDYIFTLLLFLLATDFTWMLNGMRQFAAVAMLFAASRWIFDKHPVKYVLLALIASQVHQTALIMIPIYFAVQGKPWSGRMLLMLIGTVFAIVFTGAFTSILDAALEGTQYADAEFSMEKGSNILRIIIASVPPILAFLNRDKVSELNDRAMNVCINMSIVTACLYAISAVTNGILVGRLPIYTELYSFALLPWLINTVVAEKRRSVLRLACYGCYLYYFYFAMTISMHWPYVSDVLGVFYW